MSTKSETLLILLLICWLGGAAHITATAQDAAPAISEAESVIRYINTYKGIAIAEMKRTQIPASITLAQGIIESRAGNSYLATKARNHFGIKCHKGWKGMRIFAKDDLAKDCFRKYKSVYAYFIDHSNFLTNNRRYSHLFQLQTSDYKQWAKGLKEAGYATEPAYAAYLTTIIENYQLHALDQQASENGCNCAERIIATPINFNGIRTVFFDCKITLAQVQQAYKVNAGKLSGFNGFKLTDTIPPHTIIYLQPPKKRTPPDITTHTLQTGETYQSVARLYGINLNSLYKKNRLSATSKPQPGETVFLRNAKPRKPNQATLPLKNESTLLSYTVKPGDTLFTLAQRFNTSIDTIKRANKLKQDKLLTGQKLKIYTD